MSSSRRPSNAPCTRLVRYGRAPPACAMPPRVRNGKYHTLRVLRGASPCAPYRLPGLPARAGRGVGSSPPAAKPRHHNHTPHGRISHDAKPRTAVASCHGQWRDAWPPGLPARALTKQVDFAILPRICNHRSPYGLQGLVKNGSHFSVLQSWRFFVHFPAMTDFFVPSRFHLEKSAGGNPSGASVFFFSTEFNNVEQIQRFVAGGWQQDGIRPLQQSHLPLQASPHSHDPFVTIRTTASANAMPIRISRIQDAVFIVCSPIKVCTYPCRLGFALGAGRITAQTTPKISTIATSGPTSSTGWL